MRTRTSGGSSIARSPAGYDVTITGVAEGATRTVIGGVRYAVTVHAHAYTATGHHGGDVHDARRPHLCLRLRRKLHRGDPGNGHSYVRTEENGNYVYTCSRLRRQLHRAGEDRDL